MHLPDRCGGKRLLVEVEEEPLDRLVELLADRSLDVGERKRSDIVLNFTKVGPSSSSISRRCRPRAVPAPSSTAR